MIDCSGGESYMASVFKLEIKFVKVANQVILMGVDHADLDVANAWLSLQDMKITVPIFKPKDQLTTALNRMFVTENRDAKYYTTVFRNS